MRMLLHEPTGRTYAWHRQLKNADGMIEIDKEEVIVYAEPEVHTSESQENDAESEDAVNDSSLSDLPIVQLRILARDVAKERGDTVRSVLAMNKDAIIKYIKGAE